MSSDFDKKYDIVDDFTPRHEIMTGRYKKSFAYFTLRERLPVILTGIIDHLTKDKDELAEQFGESAREEIKTVIGNISKLKYELQTDKNLRVFTGKEPDTEFWNEFVSSLPANKSFFKTCWLYAECYMYRRVRSFFEATKLLHDYDYFEKQKKNALTSCIKAVDSVALNTRNTNNDYETFAKIVKLNLWGNRCDLSISVGEEVKQAPNQLELINLLEPNLLINQIRQIWNCLLRATKKPVIVDVVCDNAGYELFTDFVLADFLVEHKIVDKVRFHVKGIPWFISDVTPNDFFWVPEYLASLESNVLKYLGRKWQVFLENGQFELAPVNYFWTGPYEYYKMRDYDPDLYKQLSVAHLIIFKGDLNYRKLLGDYTWDTDADFLTCLRGFQPSNLCTLRTVKADLICGLKSDVVAKLTKQQPSWMVTGEYGVIQFAGRDDCICDLEESN